MQPVANDITVAVHTSRIKSKAGLPSHTGRGVTWGSPCSILPWQASLLASIPHSYPGPTADPVLPY